MADLAHVSSSTLPTSIVPRISRVAQLDAALLDSELYSILAAPVLGTLSPGTRAGWEAELSLGLRSILLFLGLKSYAASYGARLSNLVLRSSKRNLWLFLLLGTLPEYIHSKIRDKMLVNGWPDYPSPRTLLSLFKARDSARRKRELRRVAWNTLMFFEKIWAACKLANMLAFLYSGRYPTLVTRLLGLRFTYARKNVARNVSFDFLNRQLVWEAFTEFLLFVMPLVDIAAVRKWTKRKLAPVLHPSRSSSASAKTDSEPDSARKGPLHHLAPEICAICHSRSSAPAGPNPSSNVADPVDPMTSTAFLTSLSRSEEGQEASLPYAVDCCGARYCYYCISSALLAWENDKKEQESVGTKVLEKGWSCLRCARPVTGARRWMGPGQGKEGVLENEKEVPKEKE